MNRDTERERERNKGRANEERALTVQMRRNTKTASWLHASNERLQLVRDGGRLARELLVMRISTTARSS